MISIIAFTPLNSDNQHVCETEFLGSVSSILQDLVKTISIVQSFQASAVAVTGCIGRCTHKHECNAKTKTILYSILNSSDPKPVLTEPCLIEFLQNINMSHYQDFNAFNFLCSFKNTGF